MMALVAVPELPQKLHSVQGVMFIKQVLSPSVHVKLRESSVELSVCFQMDKYIIAL